MYINTNDKKELKEKIEFFFNEEQLDMKEIYKDNIIFFAKSDILLKNSLNMERLDQLTEIELFHYARRLDSIKLEKSSKNLFDLLTSKNSFSRFLNEREYTFEKENNNIKMFYKLKEISKNDSDLGYNNRHRLFSRLGQQWDKDYAINGFIFEEGDEGYYKLLENGPEFIQDLSKVMKQDNLVEDYIKSSKYFCLSYKVSFEDFVFDENDPGNLRERKIKFLKYCIEYIVNGSSNHIVRLLDHLNLEGSQLIKCKEIV